MKRLFLDANVLFTAVHNTDGKADFIITFGDITHFGRYMMDPAKAPGIVVMTPAQFLGSL